VISYAMFGLYLAVAGWWVWLSAGGDQ